MENHYLELALDNAQAGALARFLYGKERIQTIPADRWKMFLLGRVNHISCRELADMADVLGQDVIEIVRYAQPRGDLDNADTAKLYLALLAATETKLNTALRSIIDQLDEAAT